jgi:hypothetical protein
MLKDKKEYTPKYNHSILQHYTSADGLIGILNDMKLNFSKQERSNDIKERRLAKHEEVDKVSISERQKKEEEIAKYKWISFFLKDENREVRQPKMYDLYANFHKGGCIEFDKEKLIERNKDLNLNFRSIKYEPYFLNQKETVKEELEYKNYQWRDENEYRIIYNGDACSININGCINRIYLGCEFIDKDKINVAKFCNILEEKDIPIEKVYEVEVNGINYLLIHSNKNSPSVEKSEMHVERIIPYLSKEYRERYGLDTKDSQKKINYIEEKYYKDKYMEVLEENRELRIQIDNLGKKAAGGDSDASDAQEQAAS